MLSAQSRATAITDFRTDDNLYICLMGELQERRRKTLRIYVKLNHLGEIRRGCSSTQQYARSDKRHSSKYSHETPNRRSLA